MPAHLTIALTIAFAVLVNAHIIVARSAQFSPAKMLKHMNDMEPEPMISYDDYNQFIPAQYASEQSMADLLQHLENQSRTPLEQSYNNVEYGPAIVDDRTPEPLPVPLQLGSDKMHKKSGPEPYHMTICHFKICNMGRKRDTSYQKF